MANYLLYTNRKILIKKLKNKMKKTILSFVMLSALFFTSCTEETASNTAEVSGEKTEIKEDIVKTSSTDEQGNTLEMTFNNTKNIVTIEFEGITQELSSKRPASGIWYTNDEYELRGKGDAIELKKGEEVVFKSTTPLSTF